MISSPSHEVTRLVATCLMTALHFPAYKRWVDAYDWIAVRSNRTNIRSWPPTLHWRSQRCLRETLLVSMESGECDIDSCSFIVYRVYRSAESPKSDKKHPTISEHSGIRQHIVPR